MSSRHSVIIASPPLLPAPPEAWSAPSTPRPRPRLWVTMVAVNLLAVAGSVAAALAAGRGAAAYLGEWTPATFFSALQLVAVGGICVWIYARARAGVRIDGGTTAGAALWLVLAAAFAFLAADEVLAIHEGFDVWLHHALGLRETPWTDRIDDAIVGAYGLAGAAVLYRWRSELRRFRRVRPVLRAACVTFLIMVVLDLLTNRYSIKPQLLPGAAATRLLVEWANVLEESVKLVSVGLFVAAFAGAAGGTARTAAGLNATANEAVAA